MLSSREAAELDRWITRGPREYPVCECCERQEATEENGLCVECDAERRQEETDNE